MPIRKKFPGPNTIATETNLWTGIPVKLKSIGMIGIPEFEQGNWKSIIGCQEGPYGQGDSANQGFYTLGINTCMAIAFIFPSAQQSKCAIRLAHLSKKVIKTKYVLSEIIKYMATLEGLNPDCKEVMISYSEYGAPVEKREVMFEHFKEALQANGILWEDNVTLLKDTTQTGSAQLAVNLTPQMGSFLLKMSM